MDPHRRARLHRVVRPHVHGAAVASPQRCAAGAGRFGKTISSENPSEFNVSRHRALLAEPSGSIARCIAGMSGGHFGHFGETN